MKRSEGVRVCDVRGIDFYISILIIARPLVHKNRRLTPKIVWEYYLVRLSAIDTVHCFMNHLIITTIESILPHPVIDRRGPEVHN